MLTECTLYLLYEELGKCVFISEWKQKEKNWLKRTVGVGRGASPSMLTVFHDSFSWLTLLLKSYSDYSITTVLKKSHADCPNDM